MSVRPFVPRNPRTPTTRSCTDHRRRPPAPPARMARAWAAQLGAGSVARRRRSARGACRRCGTHVLSIRSGTSLLCAGSAGGGFIRVCSFLHESKKLIASQLIFQTPSLSCHERRAGATRGRRAAPPGTRQGARRQPALALASPVPESTPGMLPGPRLSRNLISLTHRLLRRPAPRPRLAAARSRGRPASAPRRNGRSRA